MTASKPHAPTHIGDRTFSYDANGNQLGWVHDQNGTKRTITWDEENRIQSIYDNGQEKTYKYNDTGERVIKRGPQGETVYVNQYFVIRNKEIGTKHVYAGTTRVVSKLMKQDKPGANPQGQTPLEKTSTSIILIIWVRPTISRTQMANYMSIWSTSPLGRHG